MEPGSRLYLIPAIMLSMYAVRRHYDMVATLNLADPLPAEPRSFTGGAYLPW